MTVASFIAGLLIGALGVFTLTSSRYEVPRPEGPSETPSAEDPTTSPKKVEVIEEEPPPAATETASRREVVATRNAPDAEIGVFAYGSIKDQNGEQVDAYVSFQPSEGKSISARSDVGRYSAIGLQPGPIKVRVRSNDIVTLDTEVVIESTATQRIDFEVKRAHSVIVELVTPDGQPLSKALAEAKIYSTEVIAVATQQEPQGHLPMTDLRGLSRFGIGRYENVRGIGARRTNNKDDPKVAGTLRFEVAPPVYVSAVARHRVLATKRIEPGAEKVTLTISLETVLANLATIRCQVVDAETMEPITTANVSITDRQSAGGGRKVDENGIIVFENQPTGLLEIEVRGNDYAGYHQNLRIVPGLNDLGAIRLGKPVPVSIRVVNQTGEPQTANLHWTNLDLRTFPQPLQTNRSTQGSGDGVYKLWRTGPGRYLVKASAKDGGIGYLEVDSRTVGEDPVELVLRPVEEVVIDSTSMNKETMRTVTIFDQKRLPVYARYIRIQYEYKTSLPPGSYTYEVHDGLKLVSSGNLKVAAGSGARFRVQ